MRIFLLFLFLGARCDPISDKWIEEQVSRVEHGDIPEDPSDEEDAEDYLDTAVREKREVVSMPESLDLRDTGMLHGPISQGSCNSCGWVCGTQTLETRVAMVSENYVPYSIQNFMNCNDDVCVAAQPYEVNTYVMKKRVVVPENEIPYTKKECIYSDTCDELCGATYTLDYTNTLHDQFALVAGTVTVKSEEELLAALQHGPVTTCFSLTAAADGGRCSFGCGHANSIIGYTRDAFILQESYGATWGGNGDGTWYAERGTTCGNAVVAKARYPRVFYDYDKANAYFTEIEGGVSESELTFVSGYGITDDTTKNWGTAKNKCAYIGSACKGVVMLTTGVFELVADFGPGSPGTQTAFYKTQMVSRLRSSNHGQYIGAMKSGKSWSLVAADRAASAPFFHSYNRFISFDYPQYEMVWNHFTKLTGSSIPEYNSRYAWKLQDCKLYNPSSNKVLDVEETEGGEWQLASSDVTADSPTQRFDVGLSETWHLFSRHLGDKFRQVKGSSNTYLFKPNDPSSTTVSTMVWNARQIMSRTGKVIGPDGKIVSGRFDFNSKENWFVPKDCTLSRLSEGGTADYLSVSESGEFSMSASMDSKWDFEYEEL